MACHEAFGSFGGPPHLDDFSFMADSREKWHGDLSNFLSLCEYIGVPIAQEKTVGPNTTLQLRESRPSR